MTEMNGNALLVKEGLNDSNYHVMVKNPLRDNAFDIDDKTKIELIAKKFKDIVEILGLDLTNDSIKDTPKRVARMYVNEIFKGLNPINKPKIA